MHNDDENECLDEKERYKQVLETAKDKGSPIKTQEDFAEQYKELYDCKKPSQSNISANFKKFNIQKNKRGVYEYDENPSEEILAQRYIISNNCGIVSEVHHEMYFLQIRVRNSTEMFICKMLLNEQENTRDISIIPGFGCVIVLSKYKNRLEEIRVFLKNNKKYNPHKKS